MIEVFKTNIADRKTAEHVIRQLQQQLPGSKISFDLEDCDRILRIESGQCPVAVTYGFITSLGYECAVLET